MTEEKIKVGLEQLKEDGYEWWHVIDLGHGIKTPGKHPSVKQKIHDWGLNEISFKNKSVLDIGAWDGGFSFYAEKMGASRVVAIDTWGTANDDEHIEKTLVAHWGRKQCFDFAAEALNSKVESEITNVYDIDPGSFGRFDIVMYFGVLYHIRHPLLSLERIRGVTKDNGTLLLETQMASPPFSLDGNDCFLQYYPGGLNGDPTTFCAPTYKCLKFYLDTINFRIDREVSASNRFFCSASLTQI